MWLRLTSARADVVAARARGNGLEVSPGPSFAADATLANRLRLPYTSPIATLDRVAAVLDRACRDPGR